MSDIDKLDVACELLDRSLRLYYAGDSYFSALHLAGAAEEILGVYVERAGGESSFKNFRSAVVRLSKYLSNDGKESEPRAIGDLMNHAKNNTKHGHGPIFFSPEKEAKELLDRAITDYYFLMSHYPLIETELIRRFNKELVNA
jgi:hypothetical protein